MPESSMNFPNQEPRRPNWARDDANWVQETLPNGRHRWIRKEPVSAAVVDPASNVVRQFKDTQALALEEARRRQIEALATAALSTGKNETPAKKLTIKLSAAETAEALAELGINPYGEPSALKRAKTGLIIKTPASVPTQEATPDTQIQLDAALLRIFQTGFEFCLKGAKDTNNSKISININGLRCFDNRQTLISFSFLIDEKGNRQITISSGKKPFFELFISEKIANLIDKTAANIQPKKPNPGYRSWFLPKLPFASLKETLADMVLNELTKRDNTFIKEGIPMKVALTMRSPTIATRIPELHKSPDQHFELKILA